VEAEVTFHKELAWIEAHRLEFDGQWVALRGDQLLASGRDAKEVFDAVRTITPAALVVGIHKDDLAFAGW